MPINTALKRLRSLDTTGLWFPMILPEPNGLLTTPERYDLLGIYSNEAAGSIWVDTEKTDTDPWTDVEK
jgi:hypothetical protein